MRNALEQWCYGLADFLEWVAAGVVALGGFVAPHRHLLDFTGFHNGWIVHRCVHCPAIRYSADRVASGWAEPSKPPFGYDWERSITK